MNEAIGKAKSKLLKAAELINDAHRIMIREEGGSQNILRAEEAVLIAAAGVGHRAADNVANLKEVK